MKDLGLKHGYVIYPGNEEYRLAENVTVMPLEKYIVELSNVL